MSTVQFPFDGAAGTDDAALVTALRACARHDAAALRSLYAASAPSLLALLLQMLDDPMDANQALPDCYRLIWNEASGYLPQHCPPGDWLRGVARQVAIERLRSRAGADVPDLAGARLLVDNTAELPQFDPGTGRALRLAYLSGALPTQLATALAQPPDAVRDQLARGIADLAGPAAMSVSECLLARFVLGVQSGPVRRRVIARLRRDPAARRTRMEWERRLAVLALDPPPVRAPEQMWSRIAGAAHDGPVRSRAPASRRWLWIAALLVAGALAFVWMRLGA